MFWDVVGIDIGGDSCQGQGRDFIPLLKALWQLFKSACCKLYIYFLLTLTISVLQCSSFLASLQCLLTWEI